MLAKVVQPDHLIAELKIAETQARDMQIGQPPAVDTHNGVVAGTVMRVDPAVQNGTVTVDVQLTGELPKGARPDLSVDGTIDLESWRTCSTSDVRPSDRRTAPSACSSWIRHGKGAVRVPVKVGRASVNAIQMLKDCTKATR